MNDLNGTKQKVILVAIDLFAKKGFRGTSIRDIASAMDMSISNIYHYFGSKEGVLLAILQYASGLLVDGLREVSTRDLEPLERFKRMLETHIRLSREFHKEAKVFFLDEDHLAPEGKKINRDLQRQVLAIYLEQLKSLQALGFVSSRSLTVTAFNIFALINWHMRWFDPDGPLTLDETIEEIISFVLYGIGGPPSHESGRSEQRYPEERAGFKSHNFEQEG
ncbi:MAG: TetR family transcriptional regulator [Deltaproteobacteria bacterium]|nr:TetR family transcriptional regulator [Deltaproteobacteria bacterium]